MFVILLLCIELYNNNINVAVEYMILEMCSSYKFTICCMFNIKGSFGKWESITRFVLLRIGCLLYFVGIWWMPQGICQQYRGWCIDEYLSFSRCDKKESRRRILLAKALHIWIVPNKPILQKGHEYSIKSEKHVSTMHLEATIKCKVEENTK